MNIARINDEMISAEDFVKRLKLDDSFTSAIEQLMIDKLTVHAAKKAGIAVTSGEVQERVDQYRRVQGLHRARDTHEFLDQLGVTVDEFEAYMTEELYREKMRAQVLTPEAIEEYFRLHSPKFDNIEISHIVVDSEGKARELLALLEDEPERFGELAAEHSLDADTRHAGGYMGRFLRGALPSEPEAKLFNAAPGSLLGPFASDDGLLYEIFQVNAKHAAQLNDVTRQAVSRMVFDDWLRARAQENRLEVL